MADEAASRAELIKRAPARELPVEPVIIPRKPRGRPLGSKNKPPPPVVVTVESPGAMRTVVLELAPGSDVVGAVSAFARRRRVGVSVLSGRGAVGAVRLRLAASQSAASIVTLHGRFEVVSLSGTVLPWSSEEGESSPAASFSVTLAGAGGQVIGGTLAGEMTAAADGVVLVAATFGRAEVHRLGAEGEDGGDGQGGGREEGRHHFQQQQQASGGDVVAGGTGGGYGGGHVGHSLAEMALWAQTTSARGPVNPLPQF